MRSSKQSEIERLAPVACLRNDAGMMAETQEQDDECWMRRALEVGARGIGRTSPNPAVGAVIVKGGVELGSGWHQRAGCPHAEREAIAAVKAAHGAAALRGATAYVTLEPCSTHGRTPPCTDGLLEAGIIRVVYGATDPNPHHAGRADALLRAAGVEVIAGVLEKECERLIRPFAKVQQFGLPWVVFKTALSLDGRITRPPGEGRWLTSNAAREDVHRLRATMDAVVTSGETVRRDLPQFNVRPETLLEGKSQPWRVVWTRDRASLPMEAPIFHLPDGERTLIREDEDPHALLRWLVKEYGVHRVLLECGGAMAGEWWQRGLIDEVIAYLAPRVCGGDVPGLGGVSLPGRLTEVSFTRFGPDVRMSGMVDRFLKA